MNVWLFRRLMEAAAEGSGGGGVGGEGGGNNADLERRAVEMGWSPKDQWRGDPSRWVDAETFVKRGDEIMPILQASNRRQEAQIQGLQRQLQQATQQLTAANEAIDVLKGLNSKQTGDQARQRRKELFRQQAEARREGNTELDAQLSEEISDVNEEIKEADADASKASTATKGTSSKSTASAQPNPADDPAFQAWKAENPWFGVDEDKSAIATSKGRQIRNNPQYAGLQGKAFFDKVTEEVDKFFAVHTQAADNSRRGSKVEGSGGGGGGGSNGSRGGGGGGGSGSNSHSWNDLPAEAKAACERQANRVVGENRAFKDMAAWKTHYVQKYFE